MVTIFEDPLNLNIILCGKDTTVKIRNNKINDSHVKSVIISDNVLISLMNGDALVYKTHGFVKVQIPTLQELLIENDLTLDKIINIDPLERDRILMNLLEGQPYKVNENNEILI